MINFKCDGIKNEENFVKEINYKKVKEIKFNLRLFLEELYPSLNESDTIYAYQDKNQYKTDMYISINGIKKYISIKMGMKNSVQVLPISKFIHFLIENHIPKVYYQRISLISIC